MITMNAFKDEPDKLHQAMRDAVERVIRSGRYVLGPEVQAFESVWASRCGVAHAVGLGNGMDAIEIGLRSLDIGAGDEVITTPMTAFASVLAILRAGATPVLADIDATTALLDMESVERCITSRTRAVLLVHLYGQMRDMENWVGFCDTHGLVLIEDCAQSHMARWNNRAGGSFGQIGAYSFYPTKNLGALGDGGALVTDSASVAARASSLRNYGQSTRYYHGMLGLNSRLDEIQAAILLSRLEWLDRFTDRRRQVASAYREGIDNEQVKHMAAPQQEQSHVYHLYVVLCGRRDKLADHLEMCGVQTLVHYPIPIHLQPPCTNVRRDPQGLKVAESHATRCLSVPCHPQMDDAAVTRVLQAIHDFK